MPIRRTLKNVVKNYSDAQIKVREATSNDPWGPSSTLMLEVADLTYNVLAFSEIMQMIWKRLNDHGKNWRHVYKALVLLDYIVKTGNEKVAQQCKDNVFAIQTLKDFQFLEDNQDHGQNVREKAKQLVSLLKDEDRLKNERAKALKARERFAQSSATTSVSTAKVSPTMHTSTFAELVGIGTGGYSEFGSPSLSSLENNLDGGAEGGVDSELEAVRPATSGEEELQLQLALAMSKEEHDEELKRLKGDEVKLQMALEESRREQEMTEARYFPESPSDSPSLLIAASDSLVCDSSPFSRSRNNHSPIHQYIGPSSSSSSHPAGNEPDSRDPWSGATSLLGRGSSVVAEATPPLPEKKRVRANLCDQGVRTPPPVPPPLSVTPPSSSPFNSSVWGDEMRVGGVEMGGGARRSPWDPVAPPPDSGGVRGGGFVVEGGGDEDGFDVLSSSRSKSPSNVTSTTGKGDAWGMSEMTSSLTSESHHHVNGTKKKSAADFLGDSASLVNLDNLVARPSSSASNTAPYSGTATNPFIPGRSQTPVMKPANNPFVQQPAGGGAMTGGRYTPMAALSSSPSSRTSSPFHQPHPAPPLSEVSPLPPPTQPFSNTSLVHNAFSSDVQSSTFSSSSFPQPINQSSPFNQSSSINQSFNQSSSINQSSPFNSQSSSSSPFNPQSSSINQSLSFNQSSPFPQSTSINQSSSPFIQSSSSPFSQSSITQSSQFNQSSPFSPSPSSFTQSSLNQSSSPFIQSSQFNQSSSPFTQPAPYTQSAVPVSPFMDSSEALFTANSSSSQLCDQLISTTNQIDGQAAVPCMTSLPSTAAAASAVNSYPANFNPFL